MHSEGHARGRLGFHPGEAAIEAIHKPSDVGSMCKITMRALETARDRALSAMAPLPLVRAFDRDATIAVGTIDLLTNLHADAAARSAARMCDRSVDGIVRMAAARLAGRVAASPASSDPCARRILAVANPPAVAARLALLEQREQELTGKMSEALGTAPAPVLVARTRLGGLPESFLPSHAANAGGMVSLDAVADWLHVALHAEDCEFAALLLRAQRAVAPHNTEWLRELLDVRLKMAGLLGCGTYAHCRARTRMVGTSERTAQFLDQMAALAADNDERYRAIVELQPGARIPEGDIRHVELRRGAADPATWLGALPIESLLERLLVEIGAATGLQLAETKVPSWSPDVRVFDVSRAGRRIDRFYVDLYLRSGEVPFSGSTYVFMPHTPGVRDKPVAAAVSLGLSPGTLASAATLALLVHELGHTIDFLYETQSTRAPPEKDFFDVPSQLFEAWAEDPTVWQALGAPPEGAAVLAASVQWDTWKDLREVTAIGLIDLGYHGAAVPADLSAVHAEAFERMLPVRVDQSTHPEVELYMPTIVYAGNGHALPWGLAISTDLMGAFPRGRRDPAAWSRFFDEVLGTEGPASERIERSLGRPWNLERLRARIGRTLH